MDFIWQMLVKSFSPRQVCWLCLLSTIAISGYVLKATAKNADVEAIRVELLQAQLLDLRIRQCQAIKSGQSASFFAGQIQQQSDKYQALTKRRPELPRCEEL